MKKTLKIILTLTMIIVSLNFVTYGEDDIELNEGPESSEILEDTKEVENLNETQVDEEQDLHQTEIEENIENNDTETNDEKDELDQEKSKNSLTESVLTEKNKQIETEDMLIKSNVAYVKNYREFEKAFVDNSINKIVLMNDIKATGLSMSKKYRTGSLTIETNNDQVMILAPRSKSFNQSITEINLRNGLFNLSSNGEQEPYLNIKNILFVEGEFSSIFRLDYNKNWNVKFDTVGIKEPGVDDDRSVRQAVIAASYINEYLIEGDSPGDTEIFGNYMGEIVDDISNTRVNRLIIRNAKKTINGRPHRTISSTGSTYGYGKTNANNIIIENSKATNYNMITDLSKDALNRDNSIVIRNSEIYINEQHDGAIVSNNITMIDSQVEGKFRGSLAIGLKGRIWARGTYNSPGVIKLENSNIDLKFTKTTAENHFSTIDGIKLGNSETGLGGKLIINGTDQSLHGINIEEYVRSIPDKVFPLNYIGYISLDNTQTPSNIEINNAHLKVNLPNASVMNLDAKEKNPVNHKIVNNNGIVELVSRDRLDQSNLINHNGMDTLTFKTNGINAKTTLQKDITGFSSIYSSSSVNNYKSGGEIEFISSGNSETNIIAKPNQNIIDRNYTALFNSIDKLKLVAEEQSRINIISSAPPVMLIANLGLLDIENINSHIYLEGNSDDTLIRFDENPSGNFSYNDYDSEDSYFEIFNRDIKGTIFDYLNGNLSTGKSVSIWKRDKDNRGEPWIFSQKESANMDFVISGSHLEDISKMKRSDFPKDKYISNDGLAKKNRLIIDDYKPVLVTPNNSPLVKPTDADKFIYGRVMVPTGVDGTNLRLPYENEVYANVVDDQGNTYNKLIAQGMSTKNSELYPVYEISNINERKGYFRLELDDFAKAGSKYGISKLYRGNPKVSEEFALEAENLDQSFVTVKDVTPPKVGEISENNGVLSGVVYEDNVNVTVDLAGESVKLKANKADGWSLNLNDYNLNVGDNVRVYLEDSNGNKNPDIKTNYHDATFEAAASHQLTLKSYKVSIKNGFVSLIEFKNTDHESTSIEKSIREWMSANAYLLEGKKETLLDVSHSKILIDGQDVKDFDFDINKEEKYEIEIIHNDAPDVKASAKLSIMDYDYVHQNDKYVLYANDFYVGNRGAEMTNDEVIAKAQAQALNRDSLKEEVVKLNKNNLTEVEDVYHLNFYLEKDKNLKADVLAQVLGYNNVSENKKYVIAANDFSIMSHQVPKMSDQELIRRAKAYAFRKSDRKLLEVEVVKHDLESTPSANYMARFRIKK